MAKGLNSQGTLEKDCIDKLLRFFMKSIKLSHQKNFLKVIKTVQGVRYKVEKKNL